MIFENLKRDKKKTCFLITAFYSLMVRLVTSKFLWKLIPSLTAELVASK